MSMVMGGLGCIPELSCRDRYEGEDVRVRVRVSMGSMRLRVRTQRVGRKVVRGVAHGDWSVKLGRERF